MVLVIRRDLRRDERGVASTVGTIMALLVFLTFMSLIVNQYVPVWMKDSEASHMDGTVGQFAGLKGAIDFQALGAIMAQNAGTVFVPSTTSTAVTLGLDGVPIFSSPTTGQLTSSPSCSAAANCSWTVSFNYAINITGVLYPSHVSANSSGQIDLEVNNNYYPRGEVIYDNGAVIRAQTDGQVIVAAPVFQVLRSGDNLSVAFELVSLFGSGSASGTSTQIVDTNVFGVNQQTYTNVATSPGIVIRHLSKYAQAWFNFFNTTLSTSLHVSTPTSYTTSSGGDVVSVTTPYYALQLNMLPGGSPWMMLAINPAGLAVSFTLQQAYVNVGIGSGSNMM